MLTMCLFISQLLYALTLQVYMCFANQSLLISDGVCWNCSWCCHGKYKLYVFHYISSYAKSVHSSERIDYADAVVVDINVYLFVFACRLVLDQSVNS